MSSGQVMGQGHGVLSRAAGLVAEARHDLDRLDGEVAAHVEAARGPWVGQGADAFAALGQAWSARLHAVVRALDGLEAALRSTEHLNAATDDEQAAAFGRARQRLA